jgi:hypothetical protein
MKNVIIIIEKIEPTLPENRALHRSLQSERARQLIGPACALLDTADAGSWRLDQGSPPQLMQRDGRPAPCWISLSHSEHWVGCLISLAGPAGFDLEACQEREFATLLDYLASTREQKWLQRHFNVDAGQRFYACWTLKEALGKLYRTGWDASTGQLDLTALDRRDTDESTIQAMHLALPEWQLALSSAVKCRQPVEPHVYVATPGSAPQALPALSSWTNR